MKNVNEIKYNEKRKVPFWEISQRFRRSVPSISGLLDRSTRSILPLASPLLNDHKSERACWIRWESDD